VPVHDLLTIKRFGDAVYLGLKSLGEVRRSATRPAHAVISGENYHTLQALTLDERRVSREDRARDRAGRDRRQG
jgi:hypothetical protein